MNADFTKFGWLYDVWSDALLSMIVATEPLFQSMTAAAGALVPAAAFVWLSLLLIRLADVGLIRSLAGGALIFAVVVVGTRPATFDSAGRASVQMNQLQSLGLHLVINLQAVFNSSLSKAVADNSIEGTILPAEAATRDAVERSAAAFGRSDLASLIRDYNAQCAPDSAALSSPEHAARRDAYYAVGLLGGGGLGIPEDRISLLSQIRDTAAAGFWSISGPVWSMLGMSYMSSAQDSSAIASRRAEGIAALQSANRGFNAPGGGYALPTQEQWQGTYAGKAEATSEFLRAADAPGELAQQLQQNAGAWRDNEGKGAVIGLVPGDCVEAYKLAQWGAEQAYLALEQAGKEPTSGQRSSSESGTVGAALAWQRTLQRTFNGGEVEGDAATDFAAGTLAGLQMLKNVWAWLDLNTLLPAYVGGMAVLTWLVLLAAPIAILLSVIRGFQVLLSWCSLLLFPVCCVVIAQLLSVGVGFATAAISSQQAAVASGWLGGGADLDVLRGLLGMAAAVFLAATTWLSGQWTGVSLGGLSGSAGGAVASVTTAGNVALGAVRWAMAANKLFGQAKPARAGRPGGPSPSGAGGSGPSGFSPGRGPSGGDVQRAIRELHQSTTQGMRRSSTSSERARNYQGMQRRKAESATSAASPDLNPKSKE